jgi:preprotein translocase subunit SecE
MKVTSKMPLANPMDFFRRVPIFIGEVKTELVKVSWPARKDLIGASILVVAVTVILTIYIALLDFLLSKAVSLVMQ